MARQIHRRCPKLNGYENINKNNKLKDGVIGGIPHASRVDRHRSAARSVAPELHDRGMSGLAHIGRDAVCCARDIFLVSCFIN